MAIDLQFAISDGNEVPTLEAIDHWVSVTLSELNLPMAHLTVRVVGEDEISELNNRFRGKKGATNVLAFPFEPVPEVEYDSLGDIVICFPVVKSESIQQHKAVESHFAHMIVHGTLHLCGFDHQSDEQAAAMEAVENNVMAAIGYS